MRAQVETLATQSPVLSLARQIRDDIRAGRQNGSTRGLALGHLVCNVVIIRQHLAEEFLLYCHRNSQACPLLEVLDRGSYEPRQLAPGADLRTDLVRYAIYRNGVREEDRKNILDLWEEDFMTFLIGSGMTFDSALERAGVPIDRHRWVVRTHIPTQPAGRFHGPLVATMRWLTPQQAITAVQVTSRFPSCHGAPIHIGNPKMIGADLNNPLFGPPIPDLSDDLIPVFWACGVTPQDAALAAKIDLMITHAPGHGFLCDIKTDHICTP